MDIDTRRNLIIGALDPRHDNVDQASCPGIGTAAAKTRNPQCRSGFYVISYADPENLVQVGEFVDLPAGHTVSCINQCNYVWAGGPGAPGTTRRASDRSRPADGATVVRSGLRIFGTRRGRPIFSEPIDLWRNDGLTDYSHDVDVDDEGIAWTSGRGGLLGYATQGRWRDPRNEMRNARPWDHSRRRRRNRGRPGRRRPAADRLHSQRRTGRSPVRSARREWPTGTS